ncbi:MAG: imidazole glycerol phosphate synthase subunit HisH [Planctomycetota bacterium]|jgi:imidazole glycerol phosphate synthase glutamine amidotransferase subunit
MIDVIDYGSGNTGSLTRALDRLGASWRMVGRGSDLTGDRPVILPGVGSFGAVMEAMRDRRLDGALRGGIEKGTPFLGICVGLQVLFPASEESPGVEGLGVLKGRVIRLEERKVPQIGWNLVEPCYGSGFEPGWAYFVNSFVTEPTRRAEVLCESEYGARFCAGVRKGNVTAFQFHPEKSGLFGHAVLRRWLDAQ